MTQHIKQARDAISRMIENGSCPESIAPHIDTILALLDKEIDGGWQPIDTAPKDGTRVLLYDPYNGVGDGYYCNIRWWHYECGDDWYSEEWNPTHWMPLPTTPKGE